MAASDVCGAQAGGVGWLSDAGVGRGRGWVFDPWARRFPIWHQCAPSEKNVAVMNTTVVGAAVNVVVEKNTTAEGVAVKTAPAKLVEVKILVVKDEVSDLLGLVVFPDMPGLVMSSDLPVGFRGVCVPGLGGWSTATEPP